LVTSGRFFVAPSSVTLRVGRGCALGEMGTEAAQQGYLRLIGCEFGIGEEARMGSDELKGRHVVPPQTPASRSGGLRVL
jgi:hypothetical protein